MNGWHDRERPSHGCDRCVGPLPVHRQSGTNHVLLTPVDTGVVRWRLDRQHWFLAPLATRACRFMTLQVRSYHCVVAACVAAVLTLGAATTSFAQAGGSITGTVKDSSGGVIPGATVTLANTSLANQLMA